MKKCVNPDCQRALRYSDDKTHCPLCHSRLRTESNSRAYSYRVPNREMIQNREDIPFITRRAGRINCHGRVIEVDCEARFHNRFHKLCNTFFRGEPYQLGHETIEYVVTVENISRGMATEVSNFNIYGSILGKIHIGDEVEIAAKEKNGRNVAATVYNHTTGSSVKPGLQFPAIVLRAVVLLMIIIIGIIGYRVYSFLVSGIWVAWLVKLAMSLMPVVLGITGIQFLIKSVFRK